ncbi:MAG: tRNA(Met) cytidine acetyltransferase [Piscirickettsiaceae bacterium]|nr:tRNA(Met) cytidine acetyltransferase [Piscirickettsiaceae bacterium]
MKQRQCLVLKGDSDWCRLSLLALQSEFANERVICLSNHLLLDTVLTIPHKNAQSQLGKEFDLVIFDVAEQIDLDSLGAIMGTIRAGGALVLVISKNIKSSLWMKRFDTIVAEFSQQNDSFIVIQQEQVLPKLSPPTPQKISDKIYQTDDQQQAVAAILKVVHGHRRRPLVISSDRGRGKSAALGIAAAELILQGKRNIIVTAPSMATADTLFEHARRLLADAEFSAGLISVNDAEIRFLAPDALIESEQKADLVLVDEAAAIPASMLEKMVKKYSRVVFATTLHGYEGTGRGFAIRFQQILDRQTPNWHHYRMTTPIRWAENDMLEAFSFQALLLDATPASDERINGARVDLCEFERLDRHQLVKDEQSLRELFGLMVLAHYRTRPSDLQMMLDRDDISVYAMRYQGHIVATAWVVEEGALEDNISTAIYNGQRRLKGHLLPQSLLAHCGITSAGSLRYQRIIRIAVHPLLQQRKIGKTLLNQIIEQSVKNDYDMVGASFGMSTELLTFWTKSDFIPVRLGIHHDDVSGSHSVMMLQAVSSAGRQVLMAAKQRFQLQWFDVLHNQFKRLNADIVIALSQLFSAEKRVLSAVDEQEITAFSHAQRGYDFSQIALWHYLKIMISHPVFLTLTEQQQHLCIEKVLQQRDWTDIAKRLGYSGKAQTINALRQAIQLLQDQ